MKTLKTILIAIIGIAVFVLVGTVGAYECDNIGLAQCLIQSAISLGVMGVGVYALNCLDD
jgi:hypothetical protein